MGSTTPTYAIRFPFIDETITDVSTKNAADDMASTLSTVLDVDMTTSLKRAVAVAFRNASLSVTAAAETTITFDQETLDTDNSFTLGTPTRITVPSGMGGRWWVGAVLATTGGTAWTSGQIAIAKNGTDITRRKYWSASTNQVARLQVTAQIPLVPTDFLTATLLFQGTPSPSSIDSFRLSAVRLTT